MSGPGVWAPGFILPSLVQGSLIQYVSLDSRRGLGGDNPWGQMVVAVWLEQAPLEAWTQRAA